MQLKKLLDEAFQKGEKVKEELLVELIHSKLFNELVKNDRFIHAVTAIVTAKEEVTKVLSTRIKQVLAMMDIPTKSDIDAMTHKLSRLENQVDRAVSSRTVAKVRKATASKPKRGQTKKRK